MSQSCRPFEYQSVIDNICDLPWGELTADGLLDAAWVYSYFSLQFRENLEIACRLYPDDESLSRLKTEETDTANLSPWPGVAEPGERMDHDEFMRRLLALSAIDDERKRRHIREGEAYLDRIHALPDDARAASIASVEDDGTRMFQAILRAPRWDTPPLRAFRHFLEQHVTFDSDPTQGHGALCRHLKPDDRILPMWTASKRLFASPFRTVTA